MTLALFRALFVTFCLLLVLCCGTAGRAQTTADDPARNEDWQPHYRIRDRAASIAPEDVAFLVFRGKNMCSNERDGLRIEDRTLILKLLNALKQAEISTSARSAQWRMTGSSTEDALRVCRKSPAGSGESADDAVIARFMFCSKSVYTSFGPRFFKVLQDLEAYQSSVIRSTARAHLATARSVTIEYKDFFGPWEFTDPKEVRKLLEALSQRESRAYRCTDYYALTQGLLTIQTAKGEVIVVDTCISRVDPPGNKKHPKWLLSLWEVLKLKIPSYMWDRDDLPAPRPAPVP